MNMELIDILLIEKDGASRCVRLDVLESFEEFIANVTCVCSLEDVTEDIEAIPFRAIMVATLLEHESFHDLRSIRKRCWPWSKVFLFGPLGLYRKARYVFSEHNLLWIKDQQNDSRALKRVLTRLVERDSAALAVEEGVLSVTPEYDLVSAIIGVVRQPVLLCNALGRVLQANDVALQLLEVKRDVLVCGVLHAHLCTGEALHTEVLLTTGPEAESRSLKVLCKVIKTISGGNLLRLLFLDNLDGFIAHDDQTSALIWGYDRLTGLPDRAQFRCTLQRMLNQNVSASQVSDAAPRYALLLLDIDRFRNINDSLGHDVGDQLLVAFSERIQSILPFDVCFARLGGDEFTVLLEGPKATQAEQIAEQIQEHLRHPFDFQGNVLYATVSIGIALSKALYRSSGEVLRDADAALHRAKASGRARFVRFRTEMHQAAVSLLRIETDLREAIAREEFVLFYQPILKLSADHAPSLAGFEALVRWRHRTRGLVPPGSFIPIAEETGLIVPLGAWVLRTACKQMSQWQRDFESASSLSMNVNLSTKQLYESNFFDVVQDALHEARLASSYLKLEITESDIMHKTRRNIDLLHTLKESGIQIQVDDFGTGYSSLSYLARLPVSGLKIDRSFIQNLTQDKTQERLVQAIVNLAHMLDLDVISEGVEEQQQLDQLVDLGSDLAQGFYFDRPKDGAFFTQQFQAGLKAGRQHVPSERYTWARSPPQSPSEVGISTRRSA